MIATVTAMGWFDCTGWGRAGGSAGSKSPDVSAAWRDISPRPCERFGRMGDLAKASLIAAEMLDLPLAEESGKSPVGVLLGTRYGVFSQDYAFIRTIPRAEGPSPLLFPNTLPIAAIGEISIRFGLTGPGLVFYDTACPLAKAVYEALWMIRAGELDRAVCLACDASRAEDEYLLPDGQAALIAGATALLLSRLDESAKRDGALAMVTLEPSRHGMQAVDDSILRRRWWSESVPERLVLPVESGAVVFTRNTRKSHGSMQRR